MTTIKKICMEGLLVRLIALIIVSVFSDSLTTGYLRSSYASDDLRYIDGAVIYSENAKSIIDVPEFASAYVTVGDNVGISDMLQLWYWIICILMYIFKYPIIIKIINIFIGVICIAYIYKLCLRIYPSNQKIAILASRLYAFFPYPVFFCCFLYKDQFLTLITLLLFFTVCGNETIFRFKEMMKILILLVVFSFIRSGLTPILLLTISLIEINKSKLSFSHRKIKIIAISIITVVLTLYLYVYFSEIIIHKLEAYTSSRGNDNAISGATISYVTINTISGFWKLPFAFIFTIIQPLYIGGKITNWEGVVSILNVCSIPIVILNLIYIFKKKNNSIFWYSLMIIFAIMLYVSMGITRHFYYLLPFIFIFYSDALLSGNQIIRTINKAAIIFSFAYATMIIAYSLSYGL